MYAIETTKLCKQYDRKRALDNVDIHVKKGDVYGFIGRNGAGKTTTINILLSLIHKSEGNVKINDKEVVFNDQHYKRTIGFVPDVPVFPNYMNAKEYITYTCDMFDIPREAIPQKVQEVLQFVDLHDHKKRIGAYSRGMKQRLAIAQALVHDPEIIIMDEPTSALDPIGRKDVMNIILKLKGTKTIFYSTHILEDVEKVCDHIGLIDNGTLLLEDSIENIQKNYYQNQMLITTKEDSTTVFEFLEQQSIQNTIEKHKNGIICETNGAQTAQDVLKVLVDNGFTIQEFKRVNATLEDVFIKVTNEKTT
ncbi:ABC transporter ATP-binding protein [Candidatus Xianfuyuplasma coldseepsis]|uniref:ABC transporter ATP-binding protein n=1 Tax=Candidatus Xianfuyuplasma coldseepsis TaxID=2782163 RepID=A0A7L7KPX9_9MOLU|nr:ABC transporter ATP-binding protein [Xianfuyuplasma coldseepsis]QMS84851.1 ABC transporter ATP-binding protein [Xianfuyuplasma coldseepsis]